ncbi:c-type cytochrome [Mesorhizobium sp. SP-1A]|uniref:c-type cytochrome n=1 Tax=Mesorhizobium sp. SP-1A TaxID=3077840 RepID=UPI0028F7178A|nr:cytochrome c [Mesorhizobium sp. SP-1A]
MRKLILAISVLALGASVAQADVVKEREALMKERGKLVGSLAKVVKGEQEFDAAAVLTALKALEANAEKTDIEALFPAGSDTGDTEASPKIWEDMNGFKAAEEKYLQATKAASAAAPADVDALKAQVGAIGKSCGGCHETFRLKKS